MNRTSVMRRVLWLGGFFNFGAALMLTFPASIGQLAGLPPPGSVFYCWTLALLVALFGGVYIWLARQPQIDRPLVAVAIIGKVGVFAVGIAAWLVGATPGRAVLPAIGDLIFACLFLWWLTGESGEQQPGASNFTSP